jgi:DNA-directed RNA polymerase subunit RPC12/RpoP
MISFRCPECREEMEIADRMAGEKTRCPDCGARVVVPDESERERPRKRDRKRDEAGDEWHQSRPGDDPDARKLRTADLREVALYQRVVLFLILAYIGVVVAQFAIDPDDRWMLLFVAVPVVVAAAVFVFLLAMKLYEGLGILLGILTLVPLIGLIILLIVNQKATGTLQAHGYKVGFMGAPLSQFDRPRDSGDDD